MTLRTLFEKQVFVRLRPGATLLLKLGNPVRLPGRSSRFLCPGAAR
jgi:hypothetical protein